MIIKLAIPIKNARLQALADAMGVGAGAGAGTATLTLYAGTMPTQAGAALDPEHTELVVLDAPYPFASDITNGVMTIAPMPDAMATGEGLATWGRFRDGAGDFVADADVGDQESNALIKINNRQVYAGALIGVASAQLAEG